VAACGVEVVVAVEKRNAHDVAGDLLQGWRVEMHPHARIKHEICGPLAEAAGGLELRSGCEGGAFRSG